MKKVQSSQKRPVKRPGARINRQPETALADRQSTHRAAHGRMIRIHELVQEGRYPNATMLRQELGVSVRTFRRDIEYMRDGLNLPLAYDELRYGFYYTEEVKQFPTVKLTAGELVALCMARQLMEAHRGTPFEPQLRSAFEKITEGMQEEINVRWDELATAVSFRGMGCEVKLDPELLASLTTATREPEVVEFMYRKPMSKRPARRRVEPMHLTCLENAWYLLSYDLDRKKYRTFALSRMSELKRTGRSFVRRPDFDPEELLANSIGIYKAGKAERVRLRAQGVAAFMLKERSWHPSQRVKEVPGTNGGEVEVTMQLGITPELERWIFSWAGEVQVLEPEPLRERIRAKARGMAAG